MEIPSLLDIIRVIWPIRGRRGVIVRTWLLADANIETFASKMLSVHCVPWRARCEFAGGGPPDGERIRHRALNTTSRSPPLSLSPTLVSHIDLYIYIYIQLRPAFGNNYSGEQRNGPRTPSADILKELSDSRYIGCIVRVRWRDHRDRTWTPLSPDTITCTTWCARTIGTIVHVLAIPQRLSASPNRDAWQTHDTREQYTICTSSTDEPDEPWRVTLSSPRHPRCVVRGPPPPSSPSHRFSTVNRTTPFLPIHLPSFLSLTSRLSQQLRCSHTSGLQLTAPDNVRSVRSRRISNVSRSPKPLRTWAWISTCRWHRRISPHPSVQTPTTFAVSFLPPPPSSRRSPSCPHVRSL
ncbi:hypothetical protein HGRIS_001083 [Hohenbuehelia grisea]|uniref:Uncharacterized protein n=1 Tax=Hohenbuehelia grisea TaxID=104357 RepID=A0ABR3JN79_9AGAR